MRARDLAGDVDVESLQLTSGGIPEAEQIGVLVHADDEPAALGDRRHRRTRRHGPRCVATDRGAGWLPDRSRHFAAAGAAVTSCAPAGHGLDRRDRHRRRRRREDPHPARRRQCRAAPATFALSQELLEPRPQPDDGGRRGERPSARASRSGSTPAACPPRTPGRAAWRGSVRSRRAGWIRRRRTVRPTRQGRDRSPARPRPGSRRPGMLRPACGGWRSISATPSAAADGPALELCSQFVDVRVERLFAWRDVATRDQLQGLVGPGLLGEDAGLRELFEPRGALGSAALDVARRQAGGHDDPADGEQHHHGRRDDEPHVELPVRAATR